LVRLGWNGADLHALDLLLSSFTAQVTALTVQHKAYPILHYYHSQTAQSAAALAIAILDEALTLLCFGIPNERRPNPALLAGARASIDSYLQTLHGAFIEPADRTPPAPDLAERRRKLLGMVEADAWEWPPIRP
jgi:hypothetical protein